MPVARRHTTRIPPRRSPIPQDYDLIVPMGSPWSVYDTDRDRDVDRSGAGSAPPPPTPPEIPVLGVCFGGQALAAALGGTVEPHPRPGSAGTEIESHIPDVLAPGPWFQWHFDRFTVPEGATILAHSDSGVPAFRTGRSLGVQFHPELTSEILEGWLADADEAELRHLDGTPEGLLGRDRRAPGQARPHTDALVDHSSPLSPASSRLIEALAVG